MPLASFTDAASAVITLTVVMAIPIVAILTRHQQKMATIFQARNQAVPGQMDLETRAEMAQIRNLLNQQILAVEELRQGQMAIEAKLASGNVAERLQSQG